MSDEDTPDKDNRDDLNHDELDDETRKKELLSILIDLKREHRSIDNEIKAVIETGVTDMLKIGRMKKIKLSLKDQITFIENQLTPDIIA